jgi:hypothetical protein
MITMGAAHRHKEAKAQALKGRYKNHRGYSLDKITRTSKNKQKKGKISIILVGEYPALSGLSVRWPFGFTGLHPVLRYFALSGLACALTSLHHITSS